jgi:hypothetical protein
MAAEVITGIYFLHYIGFAGRILGRKYKKVLLKYD